MTSYEAGRVIAELLKSAHAIETLPIGSPVRAMYARLLQKLFAIAG